MSDFFKPYLLAARPKTLPAAFAPVAIGSALAFREGVFSPGIAGLCLLFALLVQITTNYANDYFDHFRGADGPERLGPTRVVSSGLLTPPQMLVGTWVSTGLALLTGLFLLPAAGIWLLPVGLLCLVMAWAYTGGPYPLAYHGLGDLFVLIFFGFIAVSLTFFLQAGVFSEAALFLGTICGLLAVNLLLINNLRDATTDAACAKRTLVVRWGADWGRLQYGVNVLAAGLAWIFCSLLYFSLWHLLGVILFLPSTFLALKLYGLRDPAAMARLLPPTAGSLLLVSFGLSILILL
jgi:1,4-dihydroxy-2-naphthoate octaprenyltransferase